MINWSWYIALDQSACEESLSYCKKCYSWSIKHSGPFFFQHKENGDEKKFHNCIEKFLLLSAFSED